MWSAIISGVTSLATDYMSERKQKAASKARIEYARTEAQIAQIQKSAETEANYDLEAMRQTQYSLKDEFALLIVTFPFIGAFLPWTQPYVEQGWTFLSEKTPPEYWFLFSGAIAASLGIRWSVMRKK